MVPRRRIGGVERCQTEGKNHAWTCAFPPARPGSTACWSCPLRRAGLATLLLDLLTEEEDLERDNRFDIELLSGRLAHAVHFLAAEKATLGLPLGLFGASTGAASARRAARPRRAEGAGPG